MDKIIEEQIRAIEIIPGAPVEGDNFFGRDKELRDLRDLLLKPGVSVFIPGPRRWGKSSYVKECMKRYNEVLNGIYINLHSVHSIKEFYDLIMKQNGNSGMEFYSVKAKDGMKSLINTISDLINKVIINEVEFETGKISDKDNHEMMGILTKVLTKLGEKKVILILDEISDFVIDIQNHCGKDEAIKFLQWLRTLRNNNIIQMVITGSISITSVLRELKVQDLINDMKEMELKPLKKEDGILFFKCLLKSKDIEVKDEALKFCEEKINKEAHYFIQLFADSIVASCNDGQVIDDEQEIREIYKEYTSRKSQAFEDYHSRLEEHFNTVDSACAKLILAHLYNSVLDFDDIYALIDGKISNKQSLLDLLTRLKEEGYIIEDDDKYTFISGILADYWYKHFRYDKGE